jgi:DUF971 family protein
MSADSNSVPTPTSITVHQATRVPEPEFDSAQFRTRFELLRVYSPSAEPQGHDPRPDLLQTGKRDVVIDSIRAVDHYAPQPVFSEGHDTGIFSWARLYELGLDGDDFVHCDLEWMAAAGADRDAAMPGSRGRACGHNH